MPLDDPPDLLYRTIVHELTHIFEFDIIPTSLIRRSEPLWINEGLSDYMTGIWQPLDLMTVRDAAVADIVPKMSELEGYGGFNNPRLIYNLGHAWFEFIESRWGKEGLRQYLFALRKSVIGGGDDAYEEAFKLKPDEFDQQFERYLKERFKPFRDKERPADYGRNLAPNPEKTSFNQAVSAEPSPSGDLIAVASGQPEGRGAGHRPRLGEGRHGHPQPDQRLRPEQGVRVHHVAGRALQHGAVDVVVAERRSPRLLRARGEDADADHPERADPQDRAADRDEDGRRSRVARLLARRQEDRVRRAAERGVGDLFILDLDTQEVTNITKDNFADSGPTWAPDGKSIVYVARVSGNEKLFRIDPATGTKTQMTFGTHDEAAAQFVDADTLVFPSTATDPNQPIDPDVARNGNIYNIWTLNLKNGELRQYTDAVGGNFSPIVLHQANDKTQIAFVSYYKGDYELHTLERKDPIITASVSDFGSPGPIIDFQAPLTHTLIAANKRKKGTFEKLFLDGRPPVNVGVTSGGNVFGGSAVTFSDVLGDKQFNLYAQSISQYRTLSFSFVNLSRRFNYAVQGYSQTLFFYGQLAERLLRPVVQRDHRPQPGAGDEHGAGRIGVRHLPVQPVSPRRAERRRAAVQAVVQRSGPPAVLDTATSSSSSGGSCSRTATSCRSTATFVEETTVFREFGPLAGRTMRVSYETAPGFGSFLSRQTIDADVRHYTRLGTTGLLALRARASGAGATRPTSSTSAATPSCAATSTWSSSARTRRLPTRSCASR